MKTFVYLLIVFFSLFNQAFAHADCVEDRTRRIMEGYAENGTYAAYKWRPGPRPPPHKGDCRDAQEAAEAEADDLCYMNNGARATRVRQISCDYFPSANVPSANGPRQVKVHITYFCECG